MSKPTQANKAPSATKAPAKAPPTPQQTGDVTLAEAPLGLLGLNGATSRQGQADRLGNARLQAVQRQMLANKIGQTHGNGHLQQVMAFVNQTKQSAPYQSNSPMAEPSTNGNGLSATNGNGYHPASADEADLEEAPATEELAQLWGESSAVSSTTAPEPPPDPLADQPHGLLQRVETAEAAPPTEAEKAAAKAKAAAARAQATQAQGQGQAETDKFQARKETEKGVGEAAKQKAAAKATGAPSSGTPLAAVPEVASNRAAPAAGQTALKSAAPAIASSDGATAKAPTSPEEDPAFQGVIAKVQGVAAQEQTHAAAGAKAKEAQAAAESPASEVAGKAQSNQVGEMAAAETPGFNAAAFKAKLMTRIEALTPKNAADADEFKEQNKAGTLKGELQGETTAQKTQAQAPLAAATAKAPDTGSVEPKPTTPLQPNMPGAGPEPLDASGATPKPKSQGEVEAPMQAQSQQLDQQMASANVTQEQLAKSNEPEFQAAGTAKQETQAHAQTAPQAYRQDEQGIVAQAQAGALTTAQTETAAMHNRRAGVLAQVDGQQNQGKSEDEKARAEVGAHIQTLYSETQGKVDAILNSLDTEVDQLFNAGAESAKQTFERFVDAEMEAYKEDRYGGLLGWAQWIKDKFSPTDPKVLAIFQHGRDKYIEAMNAVIDNVVALIGRKLAEAKAEIANGKQLIQNYVGTLAPNLQQVGQQAAQAIQDKFAELEQGVDAKQGELIDKLANQYKDKLQAVDARIDQLKAENATLYDKAANAIGGVIKTIMQLKEMLTSVLARAAAAVGQIIADPIGFLGNLVAGVKQGLQNFVGNIGMHLKGGLIGWLTGAIGGAGITLPQNWDLPGIFQLVMQVLGMSFESIMGKVSQLFGFDVMGIIEPVKQVIAIYQAEGFEGLARAGLSRLIGEERMQALMQVWGMIQNVLSGNWNALWGMVQEHLSNLKEMVFGKIEEFIGEGVIKAGVTWIISLLNPAGAFIKACKAIYDIVMFFVERGSQVMSLVNSVLDSVGAIAGGNLGAAAGAIENALAKGIPVAIGFLSSLLGLGNVSEKVQEIIQSVRGLVDKALDAIFNSRPVQMVVGFIKKVVGKIHKLVGNEQAEQEAGSATKEERVSTEFSMHGVTHQLTTVYRGGEIHIQMASREKDLLAKLSDQKRTEQGIIDQNPPDKAIHEAIKTDIENIEKWHASELNKLRTNVNPATIRNDIANLTEQLTRKIVDLGTRYGLTDLVYYAINLDEHLERIENQVKELRNSMSKGSIPGFQGDGHSNSAWAAEGFGWRHPGGEQHKHRADTAELILTSELNNLDTIERKYSVVVKTLPIYKAGQDELADIKNARTDPKGYLMNKQKNGRALWYNFFPSGIAPDGTTA